MGPNGRRLSFRNGIPFEQGSGLVLSKAEGGAEEKDRGCT